MASWEWLLVLFACCSNGIVTADDLANRTVDDDAADYMASNLSRCSGFFKLTYKRLLPNNYTDLPVLKELEWNFKERNDAACYHALFNNSSLMFEERSVQANETGETLRLGWERSKHIHSDMYCEDVGCAEYVGSYFKASHRLTLLHHSLDAYLTSIYDGLLTAIDDASVELARGEAPVHYEDVCTRANITVLTCEMLRIGGMFGENCSKPWVVLPPQCVSWLGQEWPVEPFISFWKPSCKWPQVSGEFSKLQRLRKFTRLLSSRLLHMIIAQGLCGGELKDSVPSDVLLLSIYAAGIETKDRATKSYLAIGGPKIIDEVANDFDGLVWPDSENDAKNYEQLKWKIEEAFKPDYGDDDREYLIFYPCKEEAFAMLRDVSTETLIHVRRPDVNVIVALRNAKGSTASFRLQQVDKLFKWRVSEGGCFRGVVAIECAYKFSWLELGWTYFPAWHFSFTFKSVKVRSESSHVPMCADIVFII